MKTKLFLMFTFALAVSVSPSDARGQTPMGTQFTYQGQLNFFGQPVAGPHDFRFFLYDAAVGGNQLPIGNPITITIDNFNIVDGFLSFVLDFGDMVFLGDKRWLQVDVTQTGNPTFFPLAPRTELMATPYALHTRGGIRGSGTADRVPKFTNSNTIGDSAIYESGGNVGIGTTSPVSELHLVGDMSIDAPGFIGGAGGNSFLDFRGSQGLRVRTGAVIPIMTWHNGQVEVARIENNGNVGIGTTAPTEALDVLGNINASGTLSSSNSITIDGTTDTIFATSGVISFDDEDLNTTGVISGAGLNINGPVSGTGFALSGDVTGTLDATMVVDDSHSHSSATLPATSGLPGFNIVKVVYTNNAAAGSPIPDPQFGDTLARCPCNQVVIGGGGRVIIPANSAGMVLNTSAPAVNNNCAGSPMNAWQATWISNIFAIHPYTVEVYAICVDAP